MGCFGEDVGESPARTRLVLQLAVKLRRVDLLQKLANSHEVVVGHVVARLFAAALLQLVQVGLLHSWM